MAALMTLIQTVASGMFSVWGNFITFLTAEGHELALIGVIIGLVSVFIGIIRGITRA